MTKETSICRLSAQLLIMHLAVVAMTPAALSLPVISAIWPAVYLSALLVIGGYAGQRLKTTKRPPLAALICGYLSQSPGVITSLIILIGEITHHLTPDALDFIIQVWQSPFVSWFPFLPHGQLADIPYYFAATLALSFLLPLFTAAGAAGATRRVRS